MKNHLWVFVNALIENPAFDSQCKETLTSKASSFGSKCELSDDLHKKLLKSPIVENVLSWATFKQNKARLAAARLAPSPPHLASGI